jgi:hypothetical protein
MNPRAALLLFIAFWPIWSVAERPTKEDDGFTTETEATSRKDLVSKVNLGQQAVYWVLISGLQADRQYQTRCVVTNSDGVVVHEENFNEPPGKTKSALKCIYMPEAAGIYRYTVFVEGDQIAESEITAERRILGLKPAVFVSIFILLAVVGVGMKVMGRKE